MRQTDVADIEQLFRLIQSVVSPMNAKQIAQREAKLLLDEN